MAAAWYGAWSAVSAALYGWDKRAASRGAWRVPERMLHGVDALGGWPGGAMARRVFRHKTRKASFLVVSWLIAIAHVAGWAVWWWWRRRG